MPIFAGTVVAELVNQGSKSEHQGVFLDMNGTKYQLRRIDANPFYDPVLVDLIGKNVGLEGIIHNDILYISKVWTKW